MKLLTGILGTTLLALTCVATSNIALANSHERVDRNTKCDRGFKLYKNDANQYRCERRAPSGWRIVQMQHIQGGDQMNGNQDFKPIIWKNFKGKNYAYCPRGWKAFSNRKETRCYKKALRGWSGFRGLQWDHNNNNNGSSMRVQNNNGYQYDEHRYFRNGMAACRKGKPSYDRNYVFHCK